MTYRCSCGAEITRLEVVCDDCLCYASKRLGSEGDVREYERQHGFDLYRFIWAITDQIRYDRAYNHWT